jgi:hypothetical protein
MKNRSSYICASLQFLRRISAFFTVVAFVTGVALADRDAGDKRGRGDEPSARSLQVIMEPLRSEYGLGEPIRFRVRGNQVFFLYVYTVDNETGEAILLLPNKKRQDNKYTPGRTFTVPQSSIEFYSDSAGKERIIMVASSKYIALNTARFRDVGDFSTTSTKDLEQAFADKGIRVRDEDTARRQDVVVTDIELRILEGSVGDAENTPQAVTLVSTDKSRYREGERVRIVFGADRPGWVHLYTIEPSGGYALLTRSKVDGKTLNTLSARAQSPLGSHTLVAFYSEGERFDEGRLSGVASQGRGSKRVSLDDDQTAMAIRRFRVER